MIARQIAGKALPFYLSMLSTLTGSAVTTAVLGNTGIRAGRLRPGDLGVQSDDHGRARSLRGSMPCFTENEHSPRALAPAGTRLHRAGRQGGFAAAGPPSGLRES
ncbi:hypothetical protein GCM10028793_36130 [Nocardiopsis oceani]